MPIVLPGMYPGKIIAVSEDEAYDPDLGPTYNFHVLLGRHKRAPQILDRKIVLQYLTGTDPAKSRSKLSRLARDCGVTVTRAFQPEDLIGKICLVKVDTRGNGRYQYSIPVTTRPYTWGRNGRSRK